MTSRQIQEAAERIRAGWLEEGGKPGSAQADEKPHEAWFYSAQKNIQPLGTQLKLLKQALNRNNMGYALEACGEMESYIGDILHALRQKSLSRVANKLSTDLREASKKY